MPEGILSFALPSRVGTSRVKPSAASENWIVAWVITSSPFRVKKECLFSSKKNN